VIVSFDGFLCTLPRKIRGDGEAVLEWSSCNSEDAIMSTIKVETGPFAAAIELFRHNLRLEELREISQQ